MLSLLPLLPLLRGNRLPCLWMCEQGRQRSQNLDEEEGGSRTVAFRLSTDIKVTSVERLGAILSEP